MPTGKPDRDALASLADGRVVLAVEAGDAALRLDRFLADRLQELGREEISAGVSAGTSRGDFSRSRVQALIKTGCVSDETGRKLLDPGARVKPGQRIVVRVPEAEPAQPAGEAIPLAVVYEDDHLIVIDKPAGLVVHPAAGHATGTLVNALIAHCGDSLSGIGGVRRPGIVHRLDKDTSGLLVVAKTDRAHHGLAAQFAAHGADGMLMRSYRALAWGIPSLPRGRIAAPLARSTTHRTRIAVTSAEAGRHAVTHFEVERSWSGDNGKPLASLLACRLETGRTHQIRVHLAHIGHPVMGDQTYGSHFAASARRLHETAGAALARLGRQALHAAELGFQHPVNGKAMLFASPLPPDLAELVEALGH